MNIAELLASAARSFPDCPAVSYGTRTVLRYAELGERTSRLASAIGSASYEGEVVAIVSDNCVEYLEILYGAWHAGLAAAPMNAKLTPAELAYMIEDCGAAVAFVNEGLIGELGKLLPDVDLLAPGSADYSSFLESGTPNAPVARTADDLAWIFYTSGTTGKPKGAMLSHGNLMAMTLAYYADIDFLNEEDALLHLAATSHASGLFGLSFVAKAANNIIPESDGFDPDELASLVGHYANLSFFIPPTVLRRLDRYPVISDANLENVKTVLLGAAPISAGDILAGYKLFGPKLWNGYGQGESPCTITAMSKSQVTKALKEGREDRLASVGTARCGLQVNVVDNDGCALPPGEVGEVVVKGATVMKGYLNRSEATKETLKEDWLYTGDVGSFDEEGYLTLLDRKKDVIISGGMNIYAREVEDVLLQSPDVMEVAVIGVPDPEWGESVLGVIVAAPDGDPDKEMLDRLCLDNIARFKRPKRYEFVNALPKNTSGKVLKRDLREKYTGAFDQNGG